MSELLTMSDIARRLGVSRQRIFVAAEDDPDFPEPMLDAPRRRLWDSESVERWIDARRRRTGKRRPQKLGF